MTTRIVTEGGPRTRPTIRQRIDREMHGAVVRASDAKTTPLNTYAIEDVRRGRRSPWRSMLSLIEHLHAMGVPLRTTLTLVQLLGWFARDLYRGEQPKRAA